MQPCTRGLNLQTRIRIPLSSVHKVCNYHIRRNALRHVVTPVHHLNPLVDPTRGPRDPQGSQENPMHMHALTHTHTYIRTSATGRVENITSSSKPVPFLISAVQPPPLCYLSFCLLMSSSSFFSSRQPPPPPHQCLSLLPVSLIRSVFHKLLAELKPALPEA